MRSLESLARGAVLRLLVWLGAPRRGRSLEALRRGPRRVLVLRDDAIGDMILSLGALRALAESAPDSVVDVFTSDYTADVFRGLGFVHEVIGFPRAERRRLRPVRLVWRRRPYDAVIDAMVLRGHVNSRTVLLMLASRARWRIGLAGRWHDFAYNVPVGAGGAPTQAALMRRLAEPLVAEPGAVDWTPRLVVSDDERQAACRRWEALPSVAEGTALRVLVNVSASHPERRWPDARFAEVLAWLRTRLPAARIIVLGVGDDEASARALACGVGAGTVAVRVRDVIGLVATADLVITPDTALSHAAAALDRPLVTLMRKGSERWLPYAGHGRQVWSPDEADLRRLAAADVIRVVEEAVTSAETARTVNEARSER